MRITARRARIYQTLARHPGVPARKGFDAETVYQALRSAGQPLPMSTIHTVLRELLKGGLIARRLLPRGRSVYAFVSARELSARRLRHSLLAFDPTRRSRAPVAR